MRRRHLPVHEIVRKYTEDGYSVYRLAKDYGAGRRRITDLLRTAGVILRSNSREKAAASRTLARHGEEIARRYERDGASLNELHQAYGLAVKTLQLFLTRRGVRLRSHGEAVRVSYARRRSGGGENRVRGSAPGR